MAHVTLTRYEIAQQRLPPVCIRCGQPTDEFVDRTVRYIGGRWGVCQGLGIGIAAVFIPPLFPWVYRRMPAIRVRLPFCGADQERCRRQERRALWILIPLWVLLAISVDTYCIAELVAHGPTQMLLIAATILVIGPIVDVVVLRWGGACNPYKKGLPLSFVHPAFVSALLEDRARDRVLNEDRRVGFGDIRDDFDDQAR